MIAFDAPPLPKTNAFLWLLFKRGLMDSVKPIWSVLEPISLPFTLFIQLTAFISFADASISSKNWIIDSLNGIVTLKPQSSDNKLFSNNVRFTWSYKN